MDRATYRDAKMHLEIIDTYLDCTMYIIYTCMLMHIYSREDAWTLRLHRRIRRRCRRRCIDIVVVVITSSSSSSSPLLWLLLLLLLLLFRC